MSPCMAQRSFLHRIHLFCGVLVTSMEQVLPTTPHMTHLLRSNNLASHSLPLHASKIYIKPMLPHFHHWYSLFHSASAGLMKTRLPK